LTIYLIEVVSMFFHLQIGKIKENKSNIESSWNIVFKML